MDHNAEMHKRMAHTGFNLKKDESSNSMSREIGRERISDLNLTVDETMRKNLLTN
jgi:hypothetical protein